MAAHRIIRVNNNHILPRCKSEGTLIDLSEGGAGTSLNDLKGQSHFTGNYEQENSGSGIQFYPDLERCGRENRNGRKTSILRDYSVIVKMFCPSLVSAEASVHHELT